ncbi:MAG TPA: HigA family addiction module antitoxin [Spirochaetota bacterium]|nr:HigA family addiction module antitoxin [Spirochaetota bacterium]HOV10035.1 HigA family addiction module antitoxin [Spirochaetota bacterium]
MEQTIKPFINVSPGQIIKRCLKSLNWTNRDLADVIGISEKSVSQLINNKQSITVETAILLSKAFNTSPELWLNLEQNYKLQKSLSLCDKDDVSIKAKIRRFMPMLEMRKKGWITFDNSEESQLRAYKNFWMLTDIDFSHFEKSVAIFKRQKKHNEEYTLYYTITWLRKAKIEASKIKVRAYNRNSLEKLAESISAWTIKDDGVNLFIEKLQKCGVKFFILSHLTKTYLDGAVFWDEQNPVIVYTARHNRLDNFWWTVAHEIGHILLHSDSDEKFFIDNLDDKPYNELEKEADSYARRVFWVDEILKQASHYKKYFTEARLLEISNSLKIHPSVVLGIIQFNGLVDYRTLPRYRTAFWELINKEFIKG